MKNIQDIKKVYFLGIGGIGMSAIARYFKGRGCDVAGYDRVSSVLTRQLEKEGMKIQYTDTVKEWVKEADLIVYTPAIGKDNTIFRYASEDKNRFYKRSEVLQEILKGMEVIAVAGSHGKTTTTTLIAHILRSSGVDCHAFLGGISANYGVNYWSGGKSPIAVVEADEYDRSFLRLFPKRAIITAMDADHLDIYGTVEHLREAFIEFTRQIQEGGLLVFNHRLGDKNRFGGDRRWNYSMEDFSADVHAENIRLQDRRYLFDVNFKERTTLKDIVLNIGGRYNIENTVAAISVCMDLDVASDKIKEAVASFKGVQRRFEYLIKKEDKVFIDDYAHHPAELKSLIEGVKELYPEDQMTLIFQPHLYSRTKDYAGEFAASLSLADKVILLPVYPAREEPIPGVNSEMIAGLMSKKEEVEVLSKEGLFERLALDKDRILVTAGAGDIGVMAKEIKNFLKNKER